MRDATRDESRALIAALGEKGWRFVADASDGYALWAYPPGSPVPPDAVTRMFN
jgi:hypothetical protein